MKKIFTVIIFSLTISVCFSQAGMWAWIKGPITLNSPGVFGTQGIADSANTPPGMYEPCEWTDFDGNFWLFGGVVNSTARYGDLWKYEPATNNWTWMKGTGIVNNAGIFGVQGVPSITNLPPARSYGAATWVDLNGDLWLFGGNISGGSINDLWRYNIATNTWTWMKGSSTAGTSLGVWGTQGVPSPANTPREKNECCANWVDSAGNLWMYGGFYNSYQSDMWRYNPGTNEWTWMDGDSLTNVPRNCGVKGVPSASNEPGGRLVHCTWKDTNGNFWMFGAEVQGSVYYNDMWKYDLATNIWTWMSGTDIDNDLGNYSGGLCSASVNYCPSSRKETRARWTDGCGKFWLYGGGYSNSYNDLWQFDPSTLEWQLVNGGATGNLSPVYGTFGVPSPVVQPGGKGGAVGWRNETNELYLFGGHTTGSNSVNSMWKFFPDTNCTSCVISTGMFENSAINQLLIFPNPSTNELTISSRGLGIQFQPNDKIIITDVLGKIIFTKKITAPTSQYSIHTTQFSNGIYFIHLNSKQNTFRSKFIKQ